MAAAEVDIRRAGRRPRLGDVRFKRAVLTESLKTLRSLFQALKP